MKLWWRHTPVPAPEPLPSWMNAPPPPPWVPPNPTYEIPPPPPPSLLGMIPPLPPSLNPTATAEDYYGEVRFLQGEVAQLRDRLNGSRAETHGARADASAALWYTRKIIDSAPVDSEEVDHLAGLMDRYGVARPGVPQRAVDPFARLRSRTAPGQQGFDFDLDPAPGSPAERAMFAEMSRTEIFVGGEYQPDADYPMSAYATFNGKPILPASELVDGLSDRSDDDPFIPPAEFEYPPGSEYWQQRDRDDPVGAERRRAGLER